MTTALDYGMLGEADRILSGEKVRRPVPVRDRWGRLHRDPAAEFDWLYCLSELERAYISRNYMASAPNGVQPDVVASMAGFATVDEWADAFVSAVRAARHRKLSNLDVLDPRADELAAADWTDDDDELLGPAEVCELLAIKRNTIAKWRERGRLPEPYMVLSGLPIWRKGDVTAFAVETGREVLSEVE